ncbi:MAG: phage scaffolding protein [Oscillospiraceae bacterium]|nr:phage scaffolding protein [Oscillospiraceae bacterium]
MEQLKQIFGEDALSFDELVARLESSNLHYVNTASLSSHEPELPTTPAALAEQQGSAEDCVLAADGKPSVGRAAGMCEARSGSETAVCTDESEQILTLQNELDQLRSQHTAELDAERLSHAVDLAISAARARDVEAVRPFINFDALKYNSGKVVGIDEQLRALKKAKSYLFELEAPIRSGIRQSGRSISSSSAVNDALRSVLKR